MTETSIYIKDLRMHAYHGVLEQERRVGNDYVINITVGFPWAKAATTDDVHDTLNYAALADVVAKEMSVPSNLIETVAKRICDSVKERFGDVSSISVNIRKMAPPMAYHTDGCGVVMSVTYS
ncbi:MAG: dihydroneopterin aldolase [Prevotella sp.]